MFFLVEKEIVCQYNSVSELYRWLVCLMIYLLRSYFFAWELFANTCEVVMCQTSEPSNHIIHRRIGKV